MIRFGTLLALVCFCVSSVRAAEIDKLSDGLQQLAAESEAVVVARVNSVSAQPRESGGALALWIVRSIKGRLHGGRDIAWIGQKDLPGAELGPQLWLLFLQRGQNGDWHTRSGLNNEGLVKLSDLRAPVLSSTVRFLGDHGEPPDFPEAIDEGEIKGWIEQAANGSRAGSLEGFSKLAAQSPYIIPILQNYESQSERSISAAARTLLPLVTSGPPVNGLRLGLRPGTVELHDGDRRVITAVFANVTAVDLTVVTGTTLTGESVRAITAYDIFKTDAKDRPEGSPLATVLTAPDVVADNPKSVQMPIRHVIPAISVYPAEVDLTLECKKDGARAGVRLNFPQGYIELPGFGTYALRAHFDCPGPRVDQQRLIDEHYWGGGQLVSNDILITVSENRLPDEH